VSRSGFYAWRHRQAHPSQRMLRDHDHLTTLQTLHEKSRRLYGSPRLWKQLAREGIAVACCTVERLMRRLGLQGVRRGKAMRKTTFDQAASHPLDKVNRKLRADRPNQLWVSDFTYVLTQQGESAWRSDQPD
jgi:transposase InsO family protein